MSYEYEKNALTLFIEKAEKLKMSKFVVNIANNSGFSFTLEKNKPAVSTRRGPDDENIEAFILTFRFFIQDNEVSSLRRIKDIFDSELSSAEESLNFNTARTNLNNYLNGNTIFNINGLIKRQKLMDVFIYGGLSHANYEKRKLFNEWMKNEFLVPIMKNEFSVILYEFLNIILYVQNMCKEILKRTDSK